MENQFNNIQWNVYSITNYIKENLLQICLLIIVVIIIYVVDHISQINAVIYGVSQIPGIPASNTTSNTKSNTVKPTKKRNKI